MGIKRVIETIKRSKSFLIGTHRDVEGDALGSMLGIYFLLRRLKKKVYMYHFQAVPLNYRFMPAASEIDSKPPSGRFDAGIILDCSDVSRLGKSGKAFLKADTIVNIDHHVSNTRFADINFVDPRASSAAELVYRLYKKFFPKLSKDSAVCLYTGMFTDTGSFSYVHTGSYVHKAVSDLIACGVSPVKIYHNVYSSLRPEDVLFIGKALSSLRSGAKGKIVWIKTNKWIDSAYGDLSDTIFYNLRLIKGAEVLVLIKRIGKKSVRVNFRSKGKVNVNKIAKFFGGGGHHNASGTTIEGDSINSVEKKVISFIKRHL